MGRSLIWFSSAVLMLTLLVATEMSMVAGRVCEYENRDFDGLCTDDSKCKELCAEDGSFDGHCVGLLQKCYCRWNCPPKSP